MGLHLWSCRITVALEQVTGMTSPVGRGPTPPAISTFPLSSLSLGPFSSFFWTGHCLTSWTPRSNTKFKNNKLEYKIVKPAFGNELRPQEEGTAKRMWLKRGLWLGSEDKGKGDAGDVETLWACEGWWRSQRGKSCIHNHFGLQSQSTFETKWYWLFGIDVWVQIQPTVLLIQKKDHMFNLLSSNGPSDFQQEFQTHSRGRTGLSFFSSSGIPGKSATL